MSVRSLQCAGQTLPEHQGPDLQHARKRLRVCCQSPAQRLADEVANTASAAHLVLMRSAFVMQLSRTALLRPVTRPRSAPRPINLARLVVCAAAPEGGAFALQLLMLAVDEVAVPVTIISRRRHAVIILPLRLACVHSSCFGVWHSEGDAVRPSDPAVYPDNRVSQSCAACADEPAHRVEGVIPTGHPVSTRLLHAVLRSSLGVSCRRALWPCIQSVTSVP